MVCDVHDLPCSVLRRLSHVLRWSVAYLFLLHQMGTALFRLMGALGRELNRTNMFGR